MIGNRGEILIVDDISANLQLLVNLLEDEGYTVRPTRSPEMAIESALANPPDLILLDIKMPGMDGFEVCQKLKQVKRTAGVPVIFITALHDIVDRLRGFEVGGVDFITKPILREDVLARVSAQLVLFQTREKHKETVGLRSKELQQSENEYHTLFESSSDAIILLDENTFFDCNSASLKMFGFVSRDEFLDSHLSELSPATQPDGRNSKEIMNDMITLAYQKKAHSFEWTYQRSTGEEFPVEVLLTRSTLNDKEILHATLWDLSKRKQMENILRESEKTLKIISTGTQNTTAFMDADNDITLENNISKKDFRLN